MRLADKVGVKGAHPHKFPHTFAITYLRSGGDVFTLQALLGHSSLDMVRHYAQIAEVVGTRQPSIARLKNGASATSLSFVIIIAEALGAKIEF
ncbi:MAG TPA: tyrosine-type recombinase/integrase [Bellilinea sp.]|nr:tyrosine-type recombinase/integrase [Bellilinea sp.]